MHAPVWFYCKIIFWVIKFFFYKLKFDLESGPSSNSLFCPIQLMNADNPFQKFLFCLFYFNLNIDIFIISMDARILN
jgi:hypothetical protein